MPFMSRSKDETELRVASAYAEIYLEDDHCEYQKHEDEEKPVGNSSVSSIPVLRDTWKAPSDNIENLVDSIPPYTSRVLRSKTHFGILAMGENLIQEHDTFHKDLDKTIIENEMACLRILEYQLECVVKHVKKKNESVIKSKEEMFLVEATKFYDKSLQELENHLRSELQIVLEDLEARIKKEFNFKISQKLANEKKILDTILREKVRYEVQKLKNYYQLLLDNVIHLNNMAKKQALIEKNHTLKAFLRQMKVENITNIMYVLCAARKKCKIRQFIVQNLQRTEIKDIKNKLKNKLDVLDILENEDTRVYSMKYWEEKITKIMQLFLKFIGFSLKLLPEQVTFLLDFEKMVVLQLSELKKTSLNAAPILVDTNNIFKFENIEPIEIQCNKLPFEIIGDLSESIPILKSDETIPSDIDLPHIRVDRKYIYAKCENFEEIKALLESQQCKCGGTPSTRHEIKLGKGQSHTEPHISTQEQQESEISRSMSSDGLPIEHLLMDDIQQLKNCPVKDCNYEDPKFKYMFSDVDSFIDFTEENFEKLKTFTSESPPLSKLPKINPADIVFKPLPFFEPKDRNNDAGTQYSSQETFNPLITSCPCNIASSSENSSTPEMKSEHTKSVSSVLQDRKVMLSKLVEDHPNLLNIIFTEESYDLPF